MSKLTLDEAIKWYEDKETEYKYLSKEHEDFTMMAEQYHQFVEWLRELKDLRELNDKIYDVLAKQFGSPCNCNYAVDEYMRKNGGCDDCGVEISDKECWSRYIQTKLIGGSENAE